MILKADETFGLESGFEAVLITASGEATGEVCASFTLSIFSSFFS
ncbi:hypothetical protein [Chryseobacterium wangxinyae]|nr:hypothetical protein [Chryseobacterium sp. CY353]MCY0968570.1 hypothetical protein [Chryseobacterium sp. CY353]